MSLKENEWFIEVPWGKLCVIAWGSCLDPPVLLCHGSMDSAVTFRNLVRLLPRKFYYVAMEFPGNGRSPCFPPGLMINVFDLVYTVDVVAKHFRWDSFALIAHSLGAFVGNYYNVTHPGKLSKFVQLDPINFCGVEPENFQAWYHMLYTSYYDEMDSYNVPKKARKQKKTVAIEKMIKTRDIPAEDVINTLERLSEPAGDGYIRYTFDPRYRLITTPPFSPDHIKKVFTSLKTPTLIIVSKESYEKGLYRNTKFLVEEVSYPNRNVKCIHLDGNHDLHVSGAGKLAPYLSNFLLGGGRGLGMAKL